MPDFHEPRTIGEAVGLLAADDHARCLAGGASLVAMMNFGMLEPSHLVSLRRIEELHGIREDGIGGFRIGAMTTHREVFGDARLVRSNGVLHEALGTIDIVIRNMGTIGGAIAHADPSSDVVAALVAAGATVEIVGPAGQRSAPVENLFEFYLTTTLSPGEMVTAVVLPAPAPDSAGVHEKVCRVHGDIATVNASATIAFESGAISAARLVLGGCAPVPLHVEEADACLVGTVADEAAITAAAALLVEAADPPSDVRGSADYRRLLIPRLVARLIGRAVVRREAPA
ncbi:MAG: FAD binding domain-containing protein [Rhodospirillaceae bacterium]|nr:FAD binding domain-containing protein [Rhodospirillaceae bacterium]